VFGEALLAEALGAHMGRCGRAGVAQQRTRIAAETGTPVDQGALQAAAGSAEGGQRSDQHATQAGHGDEATRCGNGDALQRACEGRPHRRQCQCARVRADRFERIMGAGCFQPMEPDMELNTYLLYALLIAACIPVLDVVATGYYAFGVRRRDGLGKGVVASRNEAPAPAPSDAP
jgi:hypothetical protein